MPLVKVYMYESFERDAELIEGILKVIDSVGIPQKYATVIIQKVPKSQWGHGK